MRRLAEEIDREYIFRQCVGREASKPALA